MVLELVSLDLKGQRTISRSLEKQEQGFQFSAHSGPMDDPLYEIRTKAISKEKKVLIHSPINWQSCNFFDTEI